jgi:hypothetical protein
MDANGDDQFVAKADSLPDDVQMAVADGIEGAGIERDAGHGPRLTRPTIPCKPPGSTEMRRKPGFYLHDGTEPNAGSARLLRECELAHCFARRLRRNIPAPG